jgi:WXG100 family type VII secretion target
MSGQILAAPEELRGHAKAVQGQADDTTSQFQSMKGRLDQLHSAFQGQAATKFEAEFEKWHNSSRNLIDALHSLGEFLNQAAQAMEETDSQLAQGLSS